MNSDNYKRAFSDIRPSDERLERIFDMTEKSRRAKGIKKGLIVVIAVLSVLMCGALTANAATDGALFEGVKLVINGEEASVSDYLKTHNSYTTDDGMVVDDPTSVSSSTAYLPSTIPAESHSCPSLTGI